MWQAQRLSMPPFQLSCRYRSKDNTYSHTTTQYARNTLHNAPQNKFLTANVLYSYALRSMCIELQLGPCIALQLENQMPSLPRPRLPPSDAPLPLTFRPHPTACFSSIAIFITCLPLPFVSLQFVDHMYRVYPNFFSMFGNAKLRNHWQWGPTKSLSTLLRLSLLLLQPFKKAKLV